MPWLECHPHTADGRKMPLRPKPKSRCWDLINAPALGIDA
jgi:hypothetical protein